MGPTDSGGRHALAQACIDTIQATLKNCCFSRIPWVSLLAESKGVVLAVNTYSVLVLRSVQHPDIPTCSGPEYVHQLLLAKTGRRSVLQVMILMVPGEIAFLDTES